MPDPRLSNLMRIAGSVADDGVVRALYRAASVDADEALEEVRQVLGGKAVEDAPTDQLDAVVDRWIRERRFYGSMVGAGLSVVGLPGVPAATAQRFAEQLRLAQRIALVYGVDWRTERGEILLWRAMAEALDVDIAWEGPAHQGTTTLPVPWRVGMDDPLVAKAVRTLVWKGVVAAVGRPRRWVPVVGAAFTLVEGFLDLDRVGKRLKRAFRVHHALARFDRAQAQPAEEVR